MYTAGWAKEEIRIEPKGYAMFGYGMWTHRAYKKRTPLFARTICIGVDTQAPMILCCLDFGCITYAIRSRVVENLRTQLGDQFKEEQLVLMATHTHSGPGGCAYEALYNMPTPGFVPEHLELVVDAVEKSVLSALKDYLPTEIRISTVDIPEEIPVAWNRSIHAYNRNFDTTFVDEDQTHLALTRQMQVLGLYRDGILHSLMSLFGVHATCLGNTLDAHDGDNKGYAAQLTEDALKETGVIEPVCIFAQATAGDVSPHFHGKNQVKLRKRIKGELEYQYAQKNGQFQSDYALLALESKASKILQNYKIKAVLEYVDLANVNVSPEFVRGLPNAQTSSACHGTAFIAGTPVDGVGAARPLIMMMNLLSERFKKNKLNSKDPAERSYYQNLYAAQGPKNIIFEAGQHRILGKKLGQLPKFLDPLIGEMNAQFKAGAIHKSELVPHVVPFQILQIGELTLVCAPGEFTTTAGKRVMKTVDKYLNQISENEVWFASYCNDYMGYVTTYEEYQVQAYEGGHTLFGQWTLAACQMHFKKLALEIQKSKNNQQISQLRPPEVHLEELQRRTNHGNIKTAVS